MLIFETLKNVENVKKKIGKVRSFPFISNQNLSSDVAAAVLGGGGEITELLSRLKTIENFKKQKRP